MPSRKTILALLLCATLAFAAGCKKRHVQAAPPTDAAPPPATQPTTESKPTEPAAKPEPKSEPAPPTLVIPPPKAAAKPGTIAPAAPPPPRVPPPQISPRLTPQEQAEYERRTKADIATAEKNLARANDRQLNATQRDMMEKIRGFLAQAREAVRANDWDRARNLARKAQLLSVELVNSF
jgi:outer membrane biosynthesis protein TonB